MKKLVLFILFIAIIITSTLCLTACNDDVVVENGTITQKVYGHPVYEEKGDFTFYIAGDCDYFVYAENEDGGQWFRVLDKSYYMSLTDDDSFIYDPQYYKVVSSFMDRS